MNDYLPEKIDPVTVTEEFIDQRRKNLNLAREGSPKEKEEGGSTKQKFRIQFN